MTPEEKRIRNREYMRKYRAEGRDDASRTQLIAKQNAISWIRKTHPDVWKHFLNDAYEQVKGYRHNDND